jgi:hypothetical protein
MHNSTKKLRKDSFVLIENIEPIHNLDLWEFHSVIIGYQEPKDLFQTINLLSNFDDNHFYLNVTYEDVKFSLKTGKKLKSKPRTLLIDTLKGFVNIFNGSSNYQSKIPENTLVTVSLNEQNDGEIISMTVRLISPKVDYAKKVFYSKDELANNIWDTIVSNKMSVSNIPKQLRRFPFTTYEFGKIDLKSDIINIKMKGTFLTFTLQDNIIRRFPSEIEFNREMLKEYKEIKRIIKDSQFF